MVRKELHLAWRQRHRPSINQKVHTRFQLLSEFLCRFFQLKIKALYNAQFAEQRKLGRLGQDWRSDLGAFDYPSRQQDGRAIHFPYFTGNRNGDSNFGAMPGMELPLMSRSSKVRLILAIQTVASGQRYMSRTASAKLAGRIGTPHMTERELFEKAQMLPPL
jgi:hypothetical protein